MQEMRVMGWKNWNCKQDVETSQAEYRNDSKMALKMKNYFKRPFSEVI